VKFQPKSPGMEIRYRCRNPLEIRYASVSTVTRLRPQTKAPATQPRIFAAFARTNKNGPYTSMAGFKEPNWLSMSPK